MPYPLSAKKLLKQYKDKRIRAFYLDSESSRLTLPQDSSIPSVAAAKRKDIFQKEIYTRPESNGQVIFVKQNGHEHSVLWKSSAEKIKQATRWGIIKTHSLTSKIIGSLGQYRIVAHEQAAKGMVSNSAGMKLAFLDLYQDRFEAMQDLESLVNRDNSAKKIQKYFERYIQKLQQISNELDGYFSDVDCPGFDERTLRQLKDDLQGDIQRALDFSQKIQKNSDNLRRFNRARGHESILEFIKQQIHQNLYELQGINQDLSFSNKRFFALTRGNLNDFIEDARKELDDHLPDLRNPVNPSHHGDFALDKEQAVTYDFNLEELTPARERQVLLAISFIEGWDKLELKKGQAPKISNSSDVEELDTITATRWKAHRGIVPQLKSLGYFLLNFIKSFVLPTRNWEEESWKNKNFHLVAAELRAHAKPNQPLWVNPWNFIKQVGYAIGDIFSGIKDFGSSLVFRLPAAMLEDWKATSEIPELSDTLASAQEECETIKKIEEVRLNQLLERCKVNTEIKYNADSLFAEADYPLTSGEQNDILTAVARGLNGFSSFFTHGFAKDPVSGVIFTCAYGVGAAVIYLPGVSTAIFGANYVNWFSHFSYSLGASKLAATIGGGCTQAQVLAAGWNALMDGYNSQAANAVYQFGEDPLTIAAYCAAAYGIGYVLANGIAGHPIPWISKRVLEDLGNNPHAGYPFVGAKIAVLFYEALIAEYGERVRSKQLELKPEDIKGFVEQYYATNKATIDRFLLAYWLSSNADDIPKMGSKHLFALSRQIDKHFSKEDSRALKKILYPETAHPSIAFQLFSIPLSYIPAVSRFGWSIILSLAAWAVEKPHPWEPIKRAGGDLFEKTKKDLTRLVTFSSSMVFLFYSGFSSIIKSFVYTAEMGIARIAGLFGAKPGHATHRFFASTHKSMRYAGEALYPVRAVKDVSTADPRAVIEKTEASYGKLLKHIKRKQTGSLGEQPSMESFNPKQDEGRYSFDLRRRHTSAQEESASPVQKTDLMS
ncbi:hypothetical protein Lqui_0374 [Legionella quinlivanii]|uniref:Uncharacterized protein n=1 Tax=Legionella quinlivanii TaxID=45073 RepID=A0A0W0Y411_9GAMM|nr:hypothetical protein [Legionella quinlivanii]KTD51530.1 hypothetical protein Lqui_0374 [Legionella quinlivanii]SEF58051.1 hypothetical protein SAMN02746093_00512 [Legionella quinlivanii DSM 21216]STY10943.1 Uncharacterised protein [Legionella quinlivanii]